MREMCCGRWKKAQPAPGSQLWLGKSTEIQLYSTSRLQSGLPCGRRYPAYQSG